MTRVVKLREAGYHLNIPLEAHEATWLHRSGIALVSPGTEPNKYDLRVDNVVGTIATSTLQVSIRPKLPIHTVMWLLFASGVEAPWRDEVTSLGTSDIVEVLARLYQRELDMVLRRGLLSGYHQVETTDVILRGRLRMHDQLGRRFGMLYPLDIQYEEFDRNTPENQTLLSALIALESLLGNSGSDTTTGIRRRIAEFTGVTPLASGELRPSIRTTRLNERYAEVLALAALILDGVGLSEEHGLRSGRGIVFRMWEVFERFVVRVLVKESGADLVNSQYVTPLFEEYESMFRIRPDIVIGTDQSISTVIDTKYKTASPTSADLYQVNTYASVLGVSDVTLLYAEPVAPRILTTAGSGVRVHIKGVDLAGNPQDVVRDIKSALPHEYQTRILRGNVSMGSLGS